ncbi:MAG: CHASE2 domain-containing protein, partial [Candidatus Eisenbacteria bacterium]|nr:CHASE2 domain-containing protein [Candidatus Eisenbacteria bacterium]
MTITGNRMRSLQRRWVPLIYLLPLAYLLWPLLWKPLDRHFYDLFHAQRTVAPWQEVIVVGIDRESRDRALEPPVYPLARHIGEHAWLVGTLTRAGAGAIVLDFDLGSEQFARPPIPLVDSLRTSGIVYLVRSVEEITTRSASGKKEHLLQARMPHPSLAAAARGTLISDLRPDPDGVLRRFFHDPRLDAFDLLTVSEGLAHRRLP